MGVILGTLTTKDGQTIPLPTAADELVMPEAETERRKEEKRYRGCLRRAPSGKIWGGGSVVNPHDVIYYGRYKVITENLKRGGLPMMKEGKIYTTGSYKLFEQFFLHPNEWIDSRTLANATGVGISSVSTLIKRAAEFLSAEGLMEEKDDPRTPKGKLHMFKGTCDNPAEEAKIWYLKMLQDKRGRGKTPTAKASRVPQPQAPVPSNGRIQVDVDPKTMEAIVRVPLTKLGAVLNLLNA